MRNFNQQEEEKREERLKVAAVKKGTYKKEMLQKKITENLIKIPEKKSV